MIRYIIIIFCLLFSCNSFSLHAEDRIISSPNIIHIGDNICSLTGHKNKNIQTILDMRNQYDCGPEKLNKATDFMWLITNIKELQTGLNEPILRFRTSRHGPVTIYRQYDDGSIEKQYFSYKEMNANWRAPYAVAANLVNADGQKPKQIVVAIETPWDPQNWMGLEILEKQDDLQSNQFNRELGALFTGLLFAPLLLNFVFFISIRQKFILFHSLMIGAIWINQISWSGQLFDIIPSATMAHRSIISHIALATMGFAACMLMRSICDPQKLGKFAHSALRITGSASLIITIIIMIFASYLPLIGSQIFHIFFAIMMFTVLSSLIYASLRGDRIAMLQLLGLSVAMALGAMRVGRALGLLNDVPILDLGFNFAVFFEALVTSFIVGIRARELRQDHEAVVREKNLLGRLAYTDSLTQLLNRRGFMQRYEKITNQIEKRNIHRSLMILDIDMFKKVNDTYGHDAGDMVLTQIGQIIHKTCRDNDVYARLGGEEFILIISSHQTSGFKIFANRLREAVEQHKFIYRKKEIHITVSIGMVEMDIENTHDFNQYYRSADQALYQAKNSGRNQIAYGQINPVNINKNESIKLDENESDNTAGENTAIPSSL